MKIDQLDNKFKKNKIKKNYQVSDLYRVLLINYNILCKE